MLVQQVREHHQQRVAEAKVLLGGRCAQCGTGSRLEFDHIDPETKLFGIAAMNTRRDEVFWAEVAKCQLLCNQHHHEKTARERWGLEPMHHGTRTAYNKRGCRCTECREWNADRRARQRARKSVAA